MNNYKMTAATFKTTEEAYEFIADNAANWVDVNIDGINYCHDIFVTYDDEYNEVCATVVYAKKIRKPTKEVTRRDCDKAIAELKICDWVSLYVDGSYIIACAHTEKPIKGAKAKSWRGLRRVIKNLGAEYQWASVNGNKFEWNRERGIW
jgi:hypothetical protein